MPSTKDSPFWQRVDADMLHRLLDETIQLVVQHAPRAQELTYEILDTVFCPTTVAKQLAVLCALETTVMILRVAGTTLRSIHPPIFSSYYWSSRSRMLEEYRERQRTAATQDEWMDLAEQIDAVQGNDVWRSDPRSTFYEQERIVKRIDEYVHLMRRADIFELMFVLRASIGRKKYGLLQDGLFLQALAGTKVLVETYHNVVCAALDVCCDAPVRPGEEVIPTDARLAFFNETRHAYGRTALLLSGGAALGFYHTGVVKTLMENRLMPRVLGGSSAGSIVCAMIGTRTDEECVQDLFNVRGTDAPGHSGTLAFNFFRPVPTAAAAPEDVAAAAARRARAQAAGGSFAEVYYNTAGAFHDAKRTLVGLTPIAVRRVTAFVYDVLAGHKRAGDLLMNDTEHFRNCVKLNVGNFTFQEAFDRTGRILNIVVTPKNQSDPPRLLNYLTAPHVLVWSAAVASSSLPGVFEANRLVVKEADGWERYESNESGQAFSDGSMEQDLPMQQLSEMFNVNHFIISQANPHAVMFASYNQKKSVWTNPVIGIANSILTFLKDQVRSWIVNMAACVASGRFLLFRNHSNFSTPRGIGTQFLTQEYEGTSSDISLIPWLGHRGLFSALLHIIYNPSEAEFREWIMAAERETWKYIPAIKSHIAEEVTLDRCVQRLRKRLLQESWDKRYHSATTEEKMGDRVPSFFKSPSLINLGGLGVSDQSTIEGLAQLQKQQKRSGSASALSPPYPPTTTTTTGENGGVPQPLPLGPLPIHAHAPTLVPEISINSGWGGLGLRGNRSSGNLQRSPSDASGLFIDEDAVTQQQQQQQQQQTTSQYDTLASGATTATGTTTTPANGSSAAAATDARTSTKGAAGNMEGTDVDPHNPKEPLEQNAGETTVSSLPRQNVSFGSLPRTKSSGDTRSGGYLKTTSMANFYYRKVVHGSSGDVRADHAAAAAVAPSETDASHHLLLLPKTNSDSIIVGANHIRRKSKSHADLAATTAHL